MEGGSIGQYRIVRKLGEGGMGSVWLGEHTLLGRRAAIKVLLPEYSNNQTIVQRFFNEARAVTAIADPGIVQVFDFGHANGSAYLVMELLEGEAMDTRLKRIGRFMPADAIRLMAQIATSLGAAHAKGVIHRDLKPENIFIVGDQAVTGGERTKVLDFGIAKLTGDESGVQKTRTGMIMGTPVFMSPEQCRGTTNIDARSDIYTLGCVLFTMLCGRPPFESEGSGDLIIMHVRDMPPRPSSIVPSLIPEIDAFVLRCLEKDPNHRFQSTAEMVQALAQVEAALFGVSESPASSMPGMRRSALTPAAGIAYRQQLTPQHQAPTRISQPGLPSQPGYSQLGMASQPGYGSQPGIGSQPGVAPHSSYPGSSSHPGSPTTLSSASTPLGAAPREGRKVGLIASLVAVVVIAGVAIAVTMSKKSDAPASASAPSETAGSNQATTPTGSNQAAGSDRAAGSSENPPLPAATPDAAVVEVDAGVESDAAVAMPEVSPVDAGVTATDAGTGTANKDRKRDKKRGGTKQGGSNATSTSGSSTVDRGD